MTWLGGWLLAPAVLMVLCAGIGLLLTSLVRADVPGALIPGVGLAGLIGIAGIATMGDATAQLAAPACAVAAVVGLVVGRRRITRDGWAALAALLAFLLAAGPSVLSGQGSVTGYIKLDDSTIFLGLVSHLMEHGRDYSMVAPSTYQLDLVNNLGTGYPVGMLMPLGVMAKLSGQDYANVYQPLLAVEVAIAALGFYACSRDLVERRWAACVVAVVAVQASLFFGYVQWGGIKEVALVALLPALAACAAAGGWRCGVLAGVVGGAILDGYGIGAAVWCAAALVAGVAVGAVRRDGRRLLGSVGAAAGALALTAIPAWATARGNADQVSAGDASPGGDLGKLIHPLDVLQGAGLWPQGDFRITPDPRWPGVLLALFGLALALAGVVIAIRRRAWRTPALVFVTVVAAIPVGLKGSPWLDAKALSSTAPVLLAAAAAATLSVRRLRPVVVLLAAGAVVSSWLVVRDVYVAPRAELIELRALGRQLAGKGPALVLNYEGYGTRYFLGPAEDEGISELRYNRIPSRSGEAFPNFTTAEIDDVDQAALFGYPIVVRRVTPVGSRPPGGFVPVHTGRYFEAWRRVEDDLPREHVSLGTPLAPGGQLTCREARAAAAGARTLAAAPIVNPVLVGLNPGTIPAAWTGTGNAQPRSDGRAVLTAALPRAGTWRVWVGGGVLGHLRVTVDGRPVGSLRHQLDASSGWLRFGALPLGAGPHRVVLAYDRGWGAGRGSAKGQLALGPLALSLEDQPAVVRLPAGQVDRLCDGRTYDWLETYD